ncbi:START-like domain-containing protein [Porphyromonas sp.]|uniref:START-like domain-containing protein n=1 Tax=Porphyromonas sp. TaxID=1924944 RepID=UPI0026DD02CC|nr:START-like domain-containing protein [Porphyromonas sp.]MDO4695258.1 START-like domain-containing protein [Porphyromonas sp.]MDO4771053.1 START-like domain-containing protein [Porphyromonas sp.]
MNTRNNRIGHQDEYVLNRASVRSVWNQITTSKGLSEWFAPNVRIDSKNIYVEWDKLGDRRDGTITEIEKDKLIKWVWNDDKNSYLSIEIVKTELTSTVSILVDDHDVGMDPLTLEQLWERHIEELRHSLGIE